MSEKNNPLDDNSKDDDYLASILDGEGHQEDSDGDDIFDEDRKATKKKRTILLSSGVALVVATGAAIAFWNPIMSTLGFSDAEGSEGQVAEQYDEEDNLNWTPEEGDFGIAPDDLDGPDEAFALEAGNEFPIDLAEWELSPRSEQDMADLREPLFERAEETRVKTVSTTLPQEAAGFTSNGDEAEFDDGSLNPMYSYWTAERFQQDTADIMTRLVNPVYGEWELFQYSGYKANTQFALEDMEDIFTQRWISDHSGENYGDYVPVYADWNENNYGLDNLLESGSRWIGEVGTVDTEFNWDEESQQYAVDLTADVQFAAWTTDQDILERAGTLELTLVSNADGANENSNYRVLVDKASLTVDGA